jgi:hypothetical protein
VFSTTMPFGYVVLAAICQLVSLIALIATAWRQCKVETIACAGLLVIAGIFSVDVISEGKFLSARAAMVIAIVAGVLMVPALLKYVGRFIKPSRGRKPIAKAGSAPKGAPGQRPAAV